MLSESESLPAGRRQRIFGGGWLADAAAVAYIGLIALIAGSTGLAYVLFPELGALAHDILRRPRGAWARAPLFLVTTPVLTAVIGTLIARHFDYGLIPVLLTVGCAITLIRLSKSPIAPAISAGLLPLTLGVKNWWYPPSILVGTGLLALISLIWQRIAPVSSGAGSARDLADDIVEESPTDFSWVPLFLIFIVLAFELGKLTGWRFVLYPPLVVIGFEMFAHSSACPWANRPFVLPLACALNAAAGVLLVTLLGVGPLPAAGSILFGALLLRALDLHVPPALAVGLLPFVMAHPDYRFPAAVAAGTLLQTTIFLTWRRLAISPD